MLLWVKLYERHLKLLGKAFTVLLVQLGTNGPVIVEVVGSGEKLSDSGSVHPVFPHGPVPNILVQRREVYRVKQ